MLDGNEPVSKRKEATMYTEAGTFMSKITEVVFAEAKFAKGTYDFDVCLHVVRSDDPAQTDWWRGEMSQNYGKGNFASLTQSEITMQTLHKIGLDGDDLTQLESQVMGKEIPVAIKAKEDGDNIYYNIWYIGDGGSAPVALDGDELKSRMNALLSHQPQKPEVAGPAATAPATATADENPFH